MDPKMIKCSPIFTGYSKVPTSYNVPSPSGPVLRERDRVRAFLSTRGN